MGGDGADADDQFLGDLPAGAAGPHHPPDPGLSLSQLAGLGGGIDRLHRRTPQKGGCPLHK